MKEFSSILSLLDYFKEPSTCYQYLAYHRWKDGIGCPHCGSAGAYITNRGYKCKSVGCEMKFSVTTGTIFENTKLPLRKWFAAIYLATAHKKGISSLQLSRDIDVTQKTAWFILHRIREVLGNNPDHLLSGMVEVDETYVGGNLKNKNKKTREKNNVYHNSFINKTTVMALVERNGNVHAHKLDTHSPKSTDLIPVIQKSVAPDTVVITDGLHAYKSLKKTHTHHIVNHAQNEYVRGIFHTNTVEGFFSILKRGIIGIYHYVSPKHMQNYCNEFAYRYNTRHVKDGQRFHECFANINCRLTYKSLIS